ncbi:GNAT family N-acetyltransferase [Larkinella insperata]|uniref:GNAT family N-acetyltransferase n=1 Tax=Larkinella insperata TaxID=332158 RepID=A0ABW3QC18_9BACT|nr:GNAT family N-acetyltransferase [Larkinella insperata]
MNYLLTGQESRRLRFRPLSPDDFDDWLPFYQHPQSTQYWEGEPDDPVLNCRNWFEKTFYRYRTNRGGMNVLIDKQTGAFVGQCGLLVQVVNQVEELEVGYSILPQFWNRGYATEAAFLCQRHAFNNALSNSLISIIHEQNIPSQTVALKTGMVADKRTIYANNPVIIYRIERGI